MCGVCERALEGQHFMDGPYPYFYNLLHSISYIVILIHTLISGTNMNISTSNTMFTIFIMNHHHHPHHHIMRIIFFSPVSRSPFPFVITGLAVSKQTCTKTGPSFFWLVHGCTGQHANITNDGMFPSST